ncbi:MAG: DUF721 domain-containing protein [Fibromonadaceae bacterium]|jgi:hypothetical protein|nr:DUF721 domain-containing protein [Fibromonadaceae bacterium]
MSNKEPLSAGVLAMNFLNEFISQEQKDVFVLEEHKEKILPGKLQEKIQIVTISNGSLLLKTASSVWRAEAMAIKSNIIAACNNILGKITVKSVKIG